MDRVEVETHATPSLDDPVFIEGLPGVGHVGKLVVEHLLEEFPRTHVRSIYSEHFPPLVTVDDHGVAALANAEFYVVDVGRDLLVLTGDYQASDPIGHYRLTDAFLNVATEFGVVETIALGGLPTGELADTHHVVGAGSTGAARDRFSTAGVEFRSNEPEGGIIGTSGLLLGLGPRRGLPTVCLMGETSGYLVDPKSATAVLGVLESVLGFDVDVTQLEDRAEEMEDVVRQLQERQVSEHDQASDEDLRYFG